MEPPHEIVVKLANGVSGTIAVPHATAYDGDFVDGLHPPTHKCAILLHGQGGHRDYCYQKHLAHRLARDLGMYSLRIDFRGCGDSEDIPDPKIGRILDYDVEDIDASCRFMIDASLNPLGTSFTILAIVGHSRGGVAMFLWACQQARLVNGGIIVPNLINCSSRYNSTTVLARYGFADEYVLLSQYRHGKYQPVPFTQKELESLSTVDMDQVKDLPLDTSVLSVYGMCDKIIPNNDCQYYANSLNRGPLSHRLELIPDASHNFFGETKIENIEGEKSDEITKLPVTKHNVYNYNYLVVDKVVDFLQPENELQRFVAASRNVGALPRWKRVEGISNFRDMGGWKINLPRFHDYGLLVYVKPNFLYRCALTSHVTEAGVIAMRNDLGIKAVFDLRSDGEIEKDGAPRELIESHGIKWIHAPVFTSDDYSPQAIAMRYTNLLTCWSTYVNVYDNILENGVSCFRQVFEYIRDEQKPFVFHCTAGKDRTGILGMLILLLVGVDKNTIAREYELTTVGLRPDHPKLREGFMKVVDKFKLDNEDTSDFELLISQGRSSFSIFEDGFNNLISSRYEAMLSTIEMFNNPNEKYGGIINYMKEYLKFLDDDIKSIYKVLVSPLAPRPIFSYDGNLEFIHNTKGNEAKL